MSVIRCSAFGVGRSAFSPSMKTLLEATAPSNIKRQTSNIPWRILDFVIGALFIYAGAIKVLDPIRFAIDIDNYKLLPWTVGVRLAFYLPWLEILCGAALIIRRFYAGALLILTVLMLVFIAATVSVKARGLDISCGCFGHLSDKLGFTWHLALDFAILIALVVLLLRQKRVNRPANHANTRE
jgi:putative oxidoreductase